MAEEQTEEKPALKPANENIYYCLATLHDEPDPNNRADLLDRNRMEWQRWLNNGRGSPEADSFDQKASRAVRSNLTALLRKRIGDPSAVLPDPSQPVDFSETHFERRLFLGSYKFPADARFDRSVLEKGVNADKSSFDSDLSFVSAKIRVSADFHGVSLNYVTLDGVAVDGRLEFRGQVRGEFSMRECTVTDQAAFSCIFKSHAYFGRAQFESAMFVNPVFDGSVDFAHASFAGAVTFFNAKFLESAVFADTTFGAEADFPEAVFEGGALFHRSEWRDRITFTNAKFKFNAQFQGAKFVKYAPDFRGAELHEATEFHDVTWPAISPSEHALRANLYAYERLKAEMERLKKHEDEQFFFRKELRVKRVLMPTFSLSWLMNFGYDMLSTYGHRVMRPLLWMGALVAVGFAALSQLPVTSAGPLPWGSAAQLSAWNLVAFLPMRGETLAALVASGFRFTWIFRAVSAVEALGGGVLLFLLALALKNRFRMR